MSVVLSAGHRCLILLTAALLAAASMSLWVGVSHGFYPFTPPPGSPLANHEHPRLFFTVGDLPGLRARIQAHYMQEFEAFVSVMDSVFGEAPSSKSDSMLRFDARNYAFLCAVDPASMGVSHQHSRQQYCDKAVEHALAIPDNCRDGGHDFTTWWAKGGCVFTVPLVYDWTYLQASEAQRQHMADKIVALYENHRNPDSYPPYNGDHHLLHGAELDSLHACVFGSLALWGDPYVSGGKAQEMLDHMAEAFITRIVGISDALFGPDGDGPYPELWGSGNPHGPAYSLSEFPSYMYMVAAASSALGNNYFHTSPFTKYVPLFYYYKLKPFAVDGKFYYAWHDTGTPHDAAYPVQCTEDCRATRPRIMRFWAHRLRDDDPQVASLASWMASNEIFGIPLERYKYAQGVRQYGLFGMFLGGERDVPSLSPVELGLPLFKRMGDWTYFKSSHHLQDSTWLEVDSSIWRYVGGHNKHMPTALQMNKYGTLIVKTVNTKGGGSCPRASANAPAFGSITGPYRDREMSVDPPGAKTYDQADPSMITEGSVSDVGDITIFDSEKGLWDVFGYDYSRWYAEDPLVQEAVQQVVYLRGPQNREYVVEFNHIVSGYENRKVLHTPADIEVVDGQWSSNGDHEWSTSGRVFSVTNTYGGSHGRLFITSVHPLQAQRVKVGGAGYEWVYADGSPVGVGPLEESCRNLAGYYTLLIGTSENDLVTVYQPGDSRTLASPSPVSPLSVAGMKGAVIDGERVVLFSVDPSRPITSVGYTVVTSGPSLHVLVGLESQRSYEVRVNGSVKEVSTSRGGVLAFEVGAPGNLQVQVGGGVPCDPHHHLGCWQGDVWWFDSCGNAEEKDQECGTQRCVDGQCVDEGCIPGDLDGDGVVSVTDLQGLVNIILGVRPADPCADLNEDSTVDILDLQLVINLIMAGVE